MKFNVQCLDNSCMRVAVIEKLSDGDVRFCSFCGRDRVIVLFRPSPTHRRFVMYVPPAMMIESAVDDLTNKRVPDRVLADQTKELGEGLGEAAAQRLGIAYPLSNDTILAFRLGLQTARSMIHASGEVVVHGADPEKIL